MEYTAFRLETLQSISFCILSSDKTIDFIAKALSFTLFFVSYEYSKKIFLSIFYKKILNISICKLEMNFKTTTNHNQKWTIKKF
jgi:hypothetical protein